MFAHFFPSVFPLRDPVMIFAIVLLLFLLAPMLMARFKLPGMIGLLLAGAILGPHAFGILERDSSFVLLGAVGLTYIMFTAALEVDLSVFKKYGVDGLVFGVLTFALPQTFGTLIAHYILRFDWMSSILMASMLASHTLLAYPIASRMGLSANRAVTATIGGTIITDTLALLVLAVVASTAQGEGGEALWWRLGVSITVFVAAIFIGLPKLGRWFFRKVPDDDSAQFVFVLSLVFMCAALSHFAGLEPIVGAFLSGLALNRLIPHNSTLMNRLNFTGEAIFIPFFLVSVGMILDATVLFGSFRTWWIAIGITFTVVSMKYLASKISGLIFGYKEEEVQVMFGLSVVQAAATLATVMVGHRIGMFDDAVVNASIITILVTCVLGPYIVDKYARPLAQQEAQGTPSTSSNGDVILIPIKSAEAAADAVEVSLVLRNSKSKAPIYPAYIVSDNENFDKEMAYGSKVLDQAMQEITAANCKAESIKRADDHPGQAIIRIRKEIRASKVILPWDAAQSTKGAKYGSVIDDLVKDGSADIILIRLVHALSGSRRLNMVFPPLKEITAQAVQMAKNCEIIAKQLGIPIQILAMQDNLSDLKKMFSEHDLKLAKSFVTYSSGRMWFPFMIQYTKPQDLIVLAGIIDDSGLGAPVATQSIPDPQRNLDGQVMAYSIVGRYPEQNFIMIFGSKYLIS